MIKPGVTAGEVDKAARDVFVGKGRTRAFRHRAGYQTGINWGERGNMSLEPGAREVLAPGMTVHMPILVFSDSGYIVGCSEHVLVTDRNFEILSTTPRAIFRA